ncbi:MAG TPA: metallophosphoesterase, partial [Candidatus Obscuribacterales bacterium]
MAFVSDPSIAVKISKMKQRVRWQDPLIAERGIDQTRMVLSDGSADSPEFSFLVVGDSGSGPHRGQNPQRQIAELMLAHREKSRFVLHTGDVIYLVGSSEYYLKNFISPYREFLVGGEHPSRIAYDKMVFNQPFLPVPGNHDYYDLPLLYGAIAGATLPLRRLLQSKLDLDIGWHGSGQGKAYARAFLDYLKALDGNELSRHLDKHYTAQTDS